MSIALRGTTTSATAHATSLSVSIPAGIAANDLLLAFATTETSTLTFPAGWNTAAATVVDASGYHYYAMYRVASGSETSLALTASATDFIGCEIIAYSGVDPSNPVSASAGVSGKTPLASAAVTTTAANCRVVAALLSQHATNFTATNGWTIEGTPLLDATQGISIVIADTTVAAAGASGSTTFAQVSNQAVNIAIQTVALLPGTIRPTGIASSETVAAPSATVYVGPAAIASQQAFGVVNVTSAYLYPTAIPGGEQDFNPSSVSAYWPISPVAAGSQENFGQASLTGTFGLNVNPAQIASVESFANFFVSRADPKLVPDYATIHQELQSLSPSAVIELFEMDITPYGGPYLYFHPGTNNLTSAIVWAGKTYDAIPMQVQGFEYTGKGQLPRPTLTISNINGAISAYLLQYGDLANVRVIRRRTLAKFLDAANFPGDYNPTADPTAAFPADIYTMDRKASETPVQVTFELAAALDLQGVQLPRRQVIQNLCTWKYRGPECGWTGGYYDFNDKPTTQANDQCGKRLTSCQCRFGSNAGLPFGAFPGAGLVKR